MKPNLITQCLAVAVGAVCLPRNFIYSFNKPWLMPARLITVPYYKGKAIPGRMQAVISPAAGQ